MMQHLPKRLLFTFFFMLVIFVQAQEQPTVLYKNFNVTASGLEHVLNQAADTLFVKSDKTVFRVSFLSHENNNNIRIDINSKEVNVPLHYLSKGRYTIAVYREDIIVAFGLERQLKIEASKGAIEDFEEGIFQASLSKEEYKRRHLKPITKSKNKDTRITNVSEDKNVQNINKIQLIESTLLNHNKLVKDHQSWLEKESVLLEANQKQSKQENAARKKTNQKYLAEKREVNSKDEVIVLNEILDTKGTFKQKEKANIKPNIADVSQTDFETKDKDIDTAKKRFLAKFKRKSKDKESKQSEVAKTKVKAKDLKYDLSTIKKKSVNRETREDYRKTHLRPNGKPFNE